MRPRHEGRGEPQVHAVDGIAQLGASMRPRHEGRGEHAASAVLSRYATDASMRPRHEGRGERPGRSSDGSGMSRRFNAATARRPWRTGNDCRALAAATTLQCGHGTKAVENADSYGSRRWCTELQCGHGTKAVENQTASATSCPPPIASMRPRHEGRGELQQRVKSCVQPIGFNAATARRPWRTARSGPPTPDAARKASMRPRHEGRGERRAAVAIRLRRRCRFNAATARRPWRTPNSSG